MELQISEEFLKKLVTTPRATGYEFAAQKLIKEYLEKDVDSLYSDRVGNLYCVINPDKPYKVMLSGHIDQIGFQVNYIDDNGLIFFTPLGGFDPTTVAGNRVKVINSEGEAFPGVIGKKAIHLMKPDERTKAPEISSLYIDIGSKKKDETLAKVKVGDFAIYDYGYMRLGDNNFVTAAGFDDAIGSFIVAEVMKELSKDKNIYAGVYGVSTVQEEIGLRGAIVSSKQIKADVGIAIDVGFTSDVPDIDKKIVGEGKLGEGPILSIGPNFNPEVLKRLVAVAKENNIPYQMQAANRGTGTDANAMQLEGMATALISVPSRYMHTASEIVCLTDVQNIVDIIVKFIQSLKEGDHFLPF